MQQLAHSETSHQEPVKWLPNQDAQNALGISRTTLHRRIKAGTYRSDKRNGRLFVAVPLKQSMEQPLFQDVPSDTPRTSPGTRGTSETSAANPDEDSILRVQAESATRERDLLSVENDQLRKTVARADGEIEHLRQISSQQASAIQDLTQEIKGLTVALHREQERHALAAPVEDAPPLMKKRKRPGWLRRTFARKKQVRIGHASA